MNATLRDVFQEDHYSPLDSAELRLAPNAAVGGDNNVKRCFTEAELATKCPSLLYTPKPPPKVPDVCVPYTTVNWSDGYKDNYGEDTGGGGFAPMIPKSKIEKYEVKSCPSQGSLPLKDNDTTKISNGGVEITLLPRVAQAVYSIKLGGKEILNTPNGTMFSTAALNVPSGASDKVSRVDEAGSANKAKTKSKVVKVAATKNAAYTLVQASYALPPGTIINGKKVTGKGTLSTTNIEKRVSIAENRVVRYQTAIDVKNPFVSGRFNTPIFSLKPIFKKIFVYNKSSHSWSTPTEASLKLDKDVLAYILTTTDHKMAMGVRVISFPLPKNFGSTFPNTFDTNITRGSVSIAVASTLTVGNRGGNPSGIYAPGGKYCVTQDFIFGTLEYVQNILNKVLGATSGTCPKLECPKVPVGTKVIPGKIASVVNANSFTVTYNNKVGKPVTTKVTKNKHAFKATELVNVTVALDTWAIKNVTKRGVGPVKPSGKTRVIVGIVTKVISADKVQVSYTKPGNMKVSHIANKAKHGMKVDEEVNVTLGYDVPYLFISVAKRAAGANKIVVGKVIKVVNANKVQIQYTKPGGAVAKPVVNKAKHGLKLGQSVDVTLKAVAPYAFVSVKARDTGVHLTLRGKVIKVNNANSITIDYKNPGGKRMTPTVTKKAHGFKVGDVIDVVVSKVPPHKILLIVKNDNVKPTPKPAPKPSPKPAPKPVPGIKVVPGNVIKVFGPNKVQIQYKRLSGSVAKPIVIKKAHKMKLNEAIVVTLKNGVFVSIAKKGAKPVPKPAPKPISGKNITKDGKVTKVFSKDRVEVTYISAGKTVKKIVNKKAHNMKVGEIVIVETKPAPDHSFVAIRKKIAPKPSPKPAPKPSPKPAPKPSPKPSPKPAPKPAPKPSPKPTPKPAPKPSPKPAPKPAPKPSPKPAPKPAPKPSSKPAPKPSPKPAPKPAPKPSSKPAPKPSPKPAPKPSPKPAPKPSPKPAPKPSPKSAPFTGKVNGKVLKVVDTGKVQIQYRKPGGATVSPIIAKLNHGMKVNDGVVITLKKMPPYALVSFVKK
jgi:hypothetical protein